MLDYEEIYRASLAKWGLEGQYDQAVEECAELIAVLKHFRRGKADAEEVIAELADVTLMVGQLIHIFGQDRVQAAIDAKIEKLRKHLQEN